MARISNLLNLKNNASVEIKCQRSSTNVSSSALLYQHFYLVFLSVHLVYEVSINSYLPYIFLNICIVYIADDVF